MPHSLRAKIKSLRYKGVITDKDCDRLCKALDNENVLEQIQAEIYEEFMTIDGGVHDKSALKCMEIIDKYKALTQECVGSTQKHVGNALDERCDDLISKQAVLDGIEELKKSPWATDKRGNGFEYLITESLDIVKDLCIKQTPSVISKPESVTEFADRCRECGARYGKLLKQKSGKWIPVSERLPEEGTYLVTVKRITGHPNVEINSFAKDLYKVDEFDFCDKKGKCGWYNYDSEYGYWEDTRVIAWMPLPEPYKPQESEDKDERSGGVWR